MTVIPLVRPRHVPAVTAAPVAARRAGSPVPRTARSGRRVLGLVLAGLLLLTVLVLSVAVGARPLAWQQVWAALTDPDSAHRTVVQQMRVPRTLLGLLAGAALGVAGAVMQSVTRNPLADPGLLGITAGASAAAATAAVLWGASTVGTSIWFAMLGAAVVCTAVYLVGGGRAATPTRLALAGAALNATLFSYVSAMMLLDAAALERMRFWTVGSLAGASPATVRAVLPFLVVGFVLALALARPLDVLALGEDSARGLGARPAAIRLGAVVTVTLLCGAATAACGPIVFVGLMVPHLVRPLSGPDLRWALPLCAVLAPVLLLGADVLGRVLGRPGELQVGLVTAVLGGPFFLALVRRGRGSRA